MVRWCKYCNALLGLYEPITNWSSDHNGLCQDCREKFGDIGDPNPENGTSESSPLPVDNPSAQRLPTPS
jgi:hypothetical protein